MDNLLMNFIRRYIKDSLVGVGAIAGKNCKISSIEENDAGSTVNFLWTDDNDVDHISALSVLNGAGAKYVNVKFFGAKGDGTTDDTTAVKNAFNYAAQYGITLYIPEGTYLVQWGNIKPEVSEKGMRIVGDGRFKSIIKFMENHNEGKFGNGVVVSGSHASAFKPNFEISNVGFYYDDDEVELDPDNQSRLLGLYGQFGKAVVEDCYFHLGGTAENKPADSCMWFQMGADIVSVKNCLVENFTNNIHGAGLWIMSDFNDGTRDYNYKIDTVVVEGNAFLTSNSDEALGLYPKLDNANPGQCFNNVYISNNVFIHKNWLDSEGDVLTSYGLLTIFVDDDDAPVVNADIVISNNYLESALAFQELIRVVGFTGVDVTNNHLVLKAHSIVVEPPATPQYSLLLFGRDTKGVVRNNYFDYTAITCEVRILLNKTAEAIWEGNIIKTGGKFVLNPSGDNNSTPKLGAKLTFCNNTVHVPTNYYLIIRKTYSAALISMTGNTVNGGLSMANIIGSGLILRGNHFNTDSTTISTVEVKTATVNAAFDYQWNDGVTIVLDTANVPSAAKIGNFRYTGKKNNLVFKVAGAEVEDSAETRALLFASTANTDIAYFGE